VIEITVVRKPKGPGGQERVPRGPKGPQGAQCTPGRVLERKRPRKTKVSAVCFLGKGRKEKKESKAHLKKVELLWGSIGALRVPIGSVGGPIKALKGPHQGSEGAPSGLLEGTIVALRHPISIGTLGSPIKVLRGPQRGP
jgi:hypothetical protein